MIDVYTSQWKWMNKSFLNTGKSELIINNKKKELIK